jgi:hypothetical protein
MEAFHEGNNMENRLHPKLILAAKLIGACSLCLGLVFLISWLLH